MAMNSSVLITRPHHDPINRYFCAWSEDVKKLAQDKGFTVYDLKGDKATRDHLDSYIKSKNPSFLFLNGHGSTNVITGHDDKVIIDSESILRGSVIYARSCDAGQFLGHKLIENGAMTFIGYRRKFICAYLQEKISRPKEDYIAILFLGPSNLVATTFIKGNTAFESHIRSQESMYKNFLKMISSSSSFEERSSAVLLWGNIKSRVFLGDQNIKI